MEADWEIELGGDAPVIDACWAGFVDLRLAPDRVAELEEVQNLAGLAQALVLLNAETSPVWTAKCDVWFVEEPIDLYEFDTTPENAAFAFAGYIDLLPRARQQWSALDAITAVCKQLTARLRMIPLKACRADLVVRRAYTAPSVDTLGITAYVTACGPTETEALSSLAAAVAAAVDAITSDGSPTQSSSPLQWKNVGE